MKRDHLEASIYDNRAEERKQKPRRSLLGLWVDLNVHIPEEEIAENRREMFKGMENGSDDQSSR